MLQAVLKKLGLQLAVRLNLIRYLVTSDNTAAYLSKRVMTDIGMRKEVKDSSENALCSAPRMLIKTRALFAEEMHNHLKGFCP